jgi:uncharacterized protein YqeY
MLKQHIEQDLKTALLEGDKARVTTLRSIKSAVLYAEVAKGAREEGLSDDAIIALLTKAAKQRQESADLYRKGGSEDRAHVELAEKVVIESYLPKQLSDDELLGVVKEVSANFDTTSPQVLGQIIAAVKQKTQGAADGGRIALLVKERLQG